MIRSRSRELLYGSFLVYAPSPETRAEEKAKRFLFDYKRDRRVLTARGPLPATVYLALRLHEELNSGGAVQLETFFTSTAVLVPVPRSAPSRGDIVWAPFSLAEALVARGLGAEVHQLLSRRSPIRKSALATRRPAPEEHYDSLAVSSQTPVEPPSEIILVDDVVTRGSTFLGAAWRLQEAFPETAVTAFAGARTMSRGFGSKIMQPVQGTITLKGARLTRDP